MPCPCQEQSGAWVDSGHPPLPQDRHFPVRANPFSSRAPSGRISSLLGLLAHCWLRASPGPPPRQALESLPLPDPFPPPWGQIAWWQPQEHLSPNACRGLPWAGLDHGLLADQRGLTDLGSKERSSSFLLRDPLSPPHAPASLGYVSPNRWTLGHFCNLKSSLRGITLSPELFWLKDEGDVTPVIHVYTCPRPHGDAGGQDQLLPKGLTAQWQG